MAKVERIAPPQPGLHPGIASEVYASWDAVSNMFLKAIEEESPKHAKYAREHRRESTKAMKLGIAEHAFLFEPFDRDERIAHAPECDRRTKKGKETWANFEEMHAGKIIIPHADYEKCRQMSRAVMADPDAARLLTGGQAELSMVWDDAETGIRCKGRLDYLNGTVIPDVKTTSLGGTHPARLEKTICNYGYHQQAAFFLDGLTVILGPGDYSFVFIVAETEEPWDVACYEADADMLHAGRKAYKRALFTLKQCRETGIWPGHGGGLKRISLPFWKLKEEGIEVAL